MRFVEYIICFNFVCVCVCPGRDISATVTPIGVKVCTTVDLSSDQVLSPLGATKCGVKKGAQCTILASQTPIFIARLASAH